MCLSQTSAKKQANKRVSGCFKLQQNQSSLVPKCPRDPFQWRIQSMATNWQNKTVIADVFFVLLSVKRLSFHSRSHYPSTGRSWGGSQLIDSSLEADWESQQQLTSDRVDPLSLPSPRWATLHASLRMLGVLMRVTGRLQAHFYCILISDRTSSASSSHVWAPNGSPASSASSLCSAEIWVLG